MKFADFEKVNSSVRTEYSVYRGHEMVDIFIMDYTATDCSKIPEGRRRINQLVDLGKGAEVERIESVILKSERGELPAVWISVQIGTHDYPDRL